MYTHGIYVMRLYVDFWICDSADGVERPTINNTFTINFLEHHSTVAREIVRMQQCLILFETLPTIL